MTKAAKPVAGACDECGQTRVLRYKEYQIYWMQGIDMEISELPEDSVLEIHPTFVTLSCKDDWKVMIPMDCIRFINIKQPF